MNDPYDNDTGNSPPAETSSSIASPLSLSASTTSFPSTLAIPSSPSPNTTQQFPSFAPNSNDSRGNGNGDQYRVDTSSIVPPEPALPTTINHQKQPSQTQSTFSPTSTQSTYPPPAIVFFDDDPLCCKYCAARALILKAVGIGVLVIGFVTIIAVVLTIQQQDSSLVVGGGSPLYPSSTGQHQGGEGGTNTSSSTGIDWSSTGGYNSTNSSTLSVTLQRVNYTTNPGWKP